MTLNAPVTARTHDLAVVPEALKLSTSQPGSKFTGMCKQSCLQYCRMHSSFAIENSAGRRTIRPMEGAAPLQLTIVKLPLRDMDALWASHMSTPKKHSNRMHAGQEGTRKGGSGSTSLEPRAIWQSFLALALYAVVLEVSWPRAMSRT